MHYRQLMNARYWQRCAAMQKYFPPVYKDRPFMVSSPTSQTLLAISGTCPKLSWDNTCGPPDTSKYQHLVDIKLQDNESLKEFVKRFGQAVLQVEACSMDAVLQIFKRSICPGTPFFESLAKKPPTTMDDLFRRANKYSMLEDDGLSDFRWPRPIATDPSTRDRSRRCAFHKIMAIQQRHADLSSFCCPKAVINYITGGPSDEEYDSRRKRQKLLRAASIRERINSIRPGLTGGIDGTIIFPPVIPPGHYNHIATPSSCPWKLGTSMCGVSWLTQAVRPTGKHQSLAAWDIVSALKTRTNLIRIQRIINHILGRYHTAGPSWPSHSQRTVFSSTGVITLQCHFGATWLHYMKAIPSTYHQMVSFLTNDGQIDLYGSQLAARQCYQIAREAGANQEDASPPEPSIAHDQ
ncbi:hypothetical protein CK203_074940 [Vitis vinifera]|uniref:Retrotransposon gag domain-containing protein n=1 Tax=Vitis vinifera TaxID=29760 RepID=A0A438E8H5_VITVI|nr:hypothetical protein CK203_074940 [Vitis vinifera]